jgi:anthranilate/para-aminobenzoate synthase component I
LTSRRSSGRLPNATPSSHASGPASTPPPKANDITTGARVEAGRRATIDVEGARWLPDEETFYALHRAGRTLPVLLEMPDPGWDVLEALEAMAGDSIAYLFETAGGPADLERRTFLAWNPEREFVLRRGWLETRARGRIVSRQRGGDPLAQLRAALEDEGGIPVPYAGGFLGGLAGYVSYDFKNFLERLPDHVRDDLGVPELRLGFVRHVLAWDRRTDTLSLRYALPCSADAGRDLARAREELRGMYAQLCALERRPAAVATLDKALAAAELRSNLSRAGYDRMLARAHEHILAGDIYQANLSHRFEAAFAGSGIDLYRRLRAINPSPFATYLRFPEHEVVSCSPERLVQLESGRVETRPIAGTRPRGEDRAADRRLQRDLLVDEKERAEHLMIVDMARNDIGRVCEPGSVRVERFMRPEAYSHVRHLVSNITGVLRADRDAFDLLGATFPGASITGVPKVRCMQIIDALESVRRGVYTGSAGYFGLDGSMDFNILIRTFLLQGGRAYFHVGGGIVADSDAEREYHETLDKGRALQEALRTAPVRARGVEAPRRRASAAAGDRT